MKIICVPLTLDAQQALDFDLAADDQLEQVFISNDLFRSLEATGFLLEINDLCGILLEDAEDDKITDMLLLQKVISSNIIKYNGSNKELSILFQRLRELFILAIRIKTGVHFYF